MRGVRGVPGRLQYGFHNLDHTDIELFSVANVIVISQKSREYLDAVLLDAVLDYEKLILIKQTTYICRPPFHAINYLVVSGGSMN